MPDITVLEKRLRNTERALLYIVNRIVPILPPADQVYVADILSQFKNANHKLGTDYNISDGFIDKIED